MADLLHGRSLEKGPVGDPLEVPRAVGVVDSTRYFLPYLELLRRFLRTGCNIDSVKAFLQRAYVPTEDGPITNYY